MDFKATAGECGQVGNRLNVAEAVERRNPIGAPSRRKLGSCAGVEFEMLGVVELRPLFSARVRFNSVDLSSRAVQTVALILPRCLIPP